ncbi:MAG TPA: tryptophan--tRNA ligase [Armatimonadota bacterium]|jgi:tryptophanyl-tRNA synthetase
MRVLSGIQPSGALHIGNYFGALRQYLDLQYEHEGFYFIANYHALTSLHDPAELRRLTEEVAVTFLALGLDPAVATMFVQSDVPEVTELSWLLSTVAPMGLLERCHAYKDKVSQGIPAEHGLFAYPVLMAADILIYDSNLVPVGQDQKQHVEVTRDLALRFNNRYGEVFVVPEPLILKEVAVVPGVDGRKMSKSYGNTIDIFAEPKPLRKLVMSIKTDSTPVEEPKDPDSDNVFQLFKLFAPEAERQEMERLYREGGAAYGEVKKRTAELMTEHFAPAREKRQELLAHPEQVREVLAAGAARARAQARITLERARAACGMW